MAELPVLNWEWTVATTIHLWFMGIDKFDSQENQLSTFDLLTMGGALSRKGSERYKDNNMISDKSKKTSSDIM